MLPLLCLDSVTFPGELVFAPTVALVYLGICVTFGAQMCSAFGVARMPVARSAAISNIIPVFGIMFGIVLLGESLFPLQWVSCAVVLAAVLISQYFQSRAGASGKQGK
jgi:EamA-like transporter family.